MLVRICKDPEFLHKILWTNKSTLNRNCYLKLRNLHEFHTENPHLIGPFELTQYLNGATYLNFLQNDLPTLLEDVPLDICKKMCFQQDGCLAHYSQTVRDYLNGGRWIGRLGSIL